MNALKIASTIVAASGAVTLCVALLLLRSRLEMIRTWKPIEVQVIRGWMGTKQAGSGDEESTSYSANYELAYIVDGKSIRSTVRSEDAFLAGPDQVQMRLNRHSTGTSGVAYVNPADPGQLRLDLPKNVNAIALPLWLLLSASSLLLIGLSLWLMGTPSVSW
jgi:hypothetical protein